MEVSEVIQLKPYPVISAKPSEWAYLDEEGWLVLPPEVAARLGLVPGAQVRVEDSGNSLRLHRPVTHLAKIYVEPTDACNLDCVTCFGNPFPSCGGCLWVQGVVQCP